MGDYTPGQVHVYDVPEDKTDEFVAVLEEWGIGRAWSDDDPPMRNWRDDFEYLDSQMRLGTLDQVAKELYELGVTFEAWEDPIYEYPGQWFGATPKLGLTTRLCDANGNIYLTVADIKAAMALDEGNHRRLSETLREYCALDWLDAFEPLVEEAVKRKTAYEGRLREAKEALEAARAGADAPQR